MVGFVGCGGCAPRPAVGHAAAVRPRVVQHRARLVPMRAALVEKLTGEQLELELQDSSAPLVIDFYATWCGPCQFMAPELEKIQEQYGSKIRVVKVDSEEEPDIATLLQVRALPTLFFIKDNQLRFRFEGALMKEQLEDVIDQVFFDKVVEPEPATQSQEQ